MELKFKLDTHKAAGHKDAATASNTMGGSGLEKG